MNNYWAKFEQRGSDIFRFDTRIYLSEIDKPSDNDRCIGAVVGKNPGSAIPLGKITGKLQGIDLDGDSLLPNVKSIFLKAYKSANKAVEENSYIQVLNLMYICDKELKSAIKKFSKYDETEFCNTEEKSFPFLWYVWGNSDKHLDKFKERFYNLKVDKNFYLHTKTKKIIESAPELKDPARHTLGLPHNLVIPHISKIL